MRFGLLGPVEVRKGGTMIPLAGAKQRALLAILLLHPNEVVSRDRLLEAIWPNRPPGDAAHLLDHQVSRLRKLLDPPELLSTRPGGYMLQVEAGDLDVHRFEETLERGREANAAGLPREAVEALDIALGLWRGPALGDVALESFARVEADRLDELRLTALEERFDAELVLGRQHALVAELDALAARHPLRERLRAQLMLALYRSGRQAEALRRYAELRRSLIQELGLEPSPELKQLEQAILRQDPSLAPPTRSVRIGRRSRIAAVVALPLASAAAVVGLLLASGGASSSRAQAAATLDGVTFMSARTGKALGHVEGLQAPVQSVFYRGALWNLSFTGVLSKIEPQQGAVIAAAGTVAVPCGLAAGAGALWVTDCNSPAVVRVDPSHDVVTGRLKLPVPRSELADATQSVAVGAGSVWVGQGFDNPSYVWRLDPESGDVQRRYVIAEGGAEAVTFGNGALWVGGGVIGRLSRIDPALNTVTTAARDFGGWLCCVAAGGGYLWAAVNPGGTVWKLSDRGEVISSVKLGGTIRELAYADGAAWASTGDAGTLVRIDPATDVTRPYVVGHNVSDAVVHNGVLAVSVQATAKDVTAGLRGRIVVIAFRQDGLDATSTDPLGVQFAFNPQQVQFHYATCAKLFNYPDAAGVRGKTLAPEVAAGMPTVSDGGRTYTFRLRSGFGFSPPSHEQVTADSFRHALERFLSPAARTFDPLRLLGDIVGAEAYASGRASTISGISSHGDTLAIRLRRPAGDLVARLALPSFCAVPAELPIVPHGLPYPIPTAGPYYLADRSIDALVLKPNPNYGGSRPRRLDAIVYRLGVAAGDATVGIARSRFDYVAAQDPVLAPGTVTAQAAHRRYRLVPTNWTDRLALNTARPPFSDASIRRAVADALDRRALAHALDRGEFELPTSTLFPPNLRSAARDPFSLRPDPAAARALMRGRRVHAVFAADVDDSGKLYDPRLVQLLRNQLAAIGIGLTVVPLPQTLSPAQRNAALAAADIARTGGNADDARDAVGYLLHLPFLRAADRVQLNRIALLASPRRDLAAAAVGRRLEREAAYIGYGDAAMPELISKRVGCAIDQPEYPGLDLAALCLTHG